MKEADEPGSTPGRSAMPNFMFGILVAGERDVEVARAHHADLAGAEAKVERLAVLGAGVFVDVAGLDHVARALQHFLDAVADQRLVAGAFARSCAPDAHISGPTVKMLQPAQEPGRK